MSEKAKEQIGELHVICFSLGNHQYGVGIHQVSEVIRMVGITEVPETPKFVKGIINLRGKVIPVLDLRKYFNLEEQRYTLQTPILIAKINDKAIGIVVDAVLDVLTIQQDSIEMPSEPQPLFELLEGVAKLEDKLLLLLDFDKLLGREAKTLLERLAVSQGDEGARQKEEGEVKQGSEKESELASILHQRSLSLSCPIEEKKEETIKLMSFSLADEWYGLDIKYIKEILRLGSKITYVPDAPAFIVGVVNLRGEIISVTDLKRFLNIKEIPCTDKARIIVVEVEGIDTGLLVDSLSGVVDLPLASIEPPISTIERIRADYIYGEIRVDEKLLAVLNLENIMTSEEMKKMSEV